MCMRIGWKKIELRLELSFSPSPDEPGCKDLIRQMMLSSVWIRENPFETCRSRREKEPVMQKVRSPSASLDDRLGLIQLDDDAAMLML
jgi:hypothetical protein